MYIPKEKTGTNKPGSLPDFGEFNFRYTEILENILKIAMVDYSGETFYLKAYIAWLLDEPMEFISLEVADQSLAIVFDILNGKHK